jgi:hypothetical protein
VAAGISRLRVGDVREDHQCRAERRAAIVKPGAVDEERDALFEVQSFDLDPFESARLDGCLGRFGGVRVEPFAEHVYRIQAE